MNKTETKSVMEEMALKRVVEARVRESFVDFFHAFPPNHPYVYGRLTLDCLGRIQCAYEKWKRGESVYLVFNIPFRHGKSDISSRTFPAWFLGNNPDLEVIISSYSFDVAAKFSGHGMGLFERASGLWGLSPSKANWSKDHWKPEGRRGSVYCMGITGSVTGKGGSLIVIDDAYSGTADAESEVVRESVWDGFRSDLFTRRAPHCFMLIIMNRWNADDICGRIEARNDRNSKEYDPDFPKFEIVKYPIESEEYRTESNPNGWLFPERYPEEWYRSAKATLGPYFYSALGLQEPSPRFGNLFNVDNVKVVDEMPEGIIWNRGWDLASSEKQLVKEDPDYTVGTLAGVKGGVLYVKDVKAFRKTALERDEIIKATALADGPAVRVWVESVGMGVDTYRRIKAMLKGDAVVMAYRPAGKGDKTARGMALAPFFDAGLVQIQRGDWNAPWLNEFRTFPSGKHDDQVDSCVIAVDDALTHRAGEPVFEKVMDRIDLCQMGSQPFVLKANGDWWLGMDWQGAEDWRAGGLIRSIWWSRRGESACVWGHVDEGGCWTITDCIVGEYKDLRDFLLRVAARSRGRDGETHEYRWNVAGGEYEPEKGEFYWVDMIRQEMELIGAGGEYPRYFDATRLDGSGGFDAIERLMDGTERARKMGDGKVERMLCVWPKEVVRALKEARYVPKNGDKAKETAIEGGGAIVCCLRMAAMEWGN